ncbi:MAG: ATP-binding cassette domain-containing protein [Candidatus Lokiarchaeota archaeon]|nr:ATP-binding cassette domain-containing protein [Candidatus Lokiarchaeota archaeon]
MGKIKLRVENITKSFPINGKRLKVLDNISFKVYEREFLSIVGPSGCGKTTLLRIIAGLEKADGGKIKIDDNSVKHKLIKNTSDRIGYIPQQFSLYPWLNVFNNVALGLKIKGINKKERDKKIYALLKMVDLTDFGNYYPKDLSGGMKQKIAIIRALAVDQVILLLDEPLVSIDAQNRNKLQQDLVNIWKKSKRTIIFVSHNIDEAVFLSDRILVMDALPSKIKKSIEINLARPRNRTDKIFNSIREKILTLLDIT